MVTLPIIKKDTIKTYCGVSMYLEGKEFLKSDVPFLIYYREWTLLKALCEGTTRPSYAVRVLLGERGIINSCCTCYTNRVVPCKHIAALLILWHERSETILERTEWINTLQETEKNEIIALLLKIVDVYPEGESCKLWLVES